MLKIHLWRKIEPKVLKKNKEFNGIFLGEKTKWKKNEVKKEKKKLKQ